MNDATDSAAPRIGPLIAAGLLLFAALFSMCGQCTFDANPDDEDWSEATEAVLEIVEPTDAIRVHPAWSEAPLPDLQPVGNLLHRQSDPILEDFAHVERVLILSYTKRADEALEILPFDTADVETRDFDTVTLHIVDVPESMRIATDARDFMDDADVSYKSPDGPDEACRLRGDEWRCDGGSQDALVRPVIRDMDKDPRRCIQAHPPSGSRHLSIEFTVDEPQDVLRVRAGLDRRAARLQRGDDVIYRIHADGELITETRQDGHTSTWTAYDIPTTGGGPVELRIDVRSVASEPHHRRFCFNIWPLTKEQAQ